MAEGTCTVKEAAGVLRRHPNTIYKLVHQGELPAVRIGGIIEINRDAVDALANGFPIAASQQARHHAGGGFVL